MSQPPWNLTNVSRGKLALYFGFFQFPTFCTNLKILLISLTVCFCSVTQSCLTLCDPMDSSMPGSSVLHYLPEFAQTRVHWVGDAIQPLYHIVSLCLSQADISYMVIASSFEMISSSSENSVSVWSLLFSWFSTVFKIQIFQIYLIGVIVERALLFLVHCILPGRSSTLSINILFSFCCCHHLLR